MKKILFLFTIAIIAISVSACSSNAERGHLVEKQEGLNLIPKEEKTESNNIINKTNSSSQSVTSYNSQTKVTVDSKKNKTMLSPDQQPQLIKDYSQALIKTNYGNIKVKFYSKDAPLSVNNFLYLAKEGFYNNTKFHRVIKDFMIQGGDPLSKSNEQARWGTGGPGYRFKDEINNHKLVAGSLAMANAGPNTNGSQFFIVTATATPWLDGHHTNFGEVISGMDVVKKIGNVSTGIADRPNKDVVINSIELIK